MLSLTLLILLSCREDGKPENVTEELQQDLAAAAAAAQGNRHGQKATDTKLTKEQLEEVIDCGLESANFGTWSSS